MSFVRCLTPIFLVLALAATARSQSTPELAVSAPLYTGSVPASVNAPIALDTHVSGVPQLSSDPGASYTLYLDFSGFSFTGTWGGSGKTPGTVAAFDGVTGSFSSSEQDRIKAVWAGIAQAYAPFNINVTTVDPAVSAGSADTDAHRQAYYDATARLMHTVMTPSASWYGSAGGVSYVGVTRNFYNPAGTNGGAGAGWHTNWNFADTSYPNFQAAQPGIHENGHGLDLSHQSDYAGATLVNEYSVGDGNSTNGTYSPIMGAGYYTQRAVWRAGSSNNGLTGNTQNDVALMLSYNTGLQLVDDGIGHSRATATPLPLSGSIVNYNLAKGLIEPSSSSSPTPIGAGNYTQDYFSFQSDGVTPISLTVHDGTEYITPGVADNAVTLRSTLKILDGTGSTVGNGVEDSSTLFETYNGTLPAGTYYADIASFGGHTQTLTLSGTTMNTTNYYDMGGYFITGSGLTIVPEPSSLALLAAASALAIVAIRRKMAS